MSRDFLKSEGGAVAVEAALVMGLLLVPLLFGFWDVAQIGLAQAEVQEGLQDAVSYVAAGNSNNEAGITTAAQAAYGSSISISMSTVCYCVSMTSSSPTMPTSISCTSSCAAGTDLEQFMILTVSKTISVPFTVPYLGASKTVTSTGQVRIG